ncbi:MAG: hypothetical protein ACD_59C00053G0005 [uncultured bacterium]|nr:MAG: hypothetical protein ACD_59C00053G0005 [uncultured bacterium]
MKFIKFQNTILNVNQIRQFILRGNRIFSELDLRDSIILDFKDDETALKAIIKIAEFLSYSGFSATSGPQIMGYRFSSALLDLDKIA